MQLRSVIQTTILAHPPICAAVGASKHSFGYGAPRTWQRLAIVATSSSGMIGLLKKV